MIARICAARANKRQLAEHMDGVVNGIEKLNTESTATVRIPALISLDVADIYNG